MSSPPNHRRFPGRSLSTSRSISHSVYAPTATSRPFLNMLNPLGRAYQGYRAASQSVLEEDEEDAASPGDEDIDLEAQAPPTSNSKASLAASTHLQRLSRGTAEADMLRPNVREDDRMQEESESDGEVPQSFLIESPATRRAPLSRKGRARDTRHPPSATAPVDPPRISVPPPPFGDQSRPSTRSIPVCRRAAQSEARPRCVRACAVELGERVQPRCLSSGGVPVLPWERDIFHCPQAWAESSVGAPFAFRRGSLMPCPAPSGLSSPFRRSSSAAWIIPTYILIKSHGYPISS